MKEYNNCDCCNHRYNTNTLIWITEDFKPLETDKYPERLKDTTYVALCEECYNKIVNPKENSKVLL